MILIKSLTSVMKLQINYLSYLLVAKLIISKVIRKSEIKSRDFLQPKIQYNKLNPNK